MRDLYRQLDLPSSADEQRIRTALAQKRGSMDTQTIEDIETVLLNPEVRPKYDRVRSTLLTIGTARSRLPGVAAQNWTSIIGGDFFRESANKQGNQPRGGRTKNQAQNSGSFFERNAGALIPVVVVVLLGVLGIYGTDQRTDDSPSWNAESGTGSDENISTDTEPTQDASEPPAFTDQSPLSENEVCYLQERLALLGLYEGAIDGLNGPRTSSAIKAFRDRHGISAAGPTAGVLDAARYYGQESVTRTPADSRPATRTVMHSPLRDAVAPLRVTVASGGDYFVKLTTPEDENTITSFYLRAGDSWETKVPTGRYELRYAAGRGWYNTRCLFGEETATAKADELLSFTRTGQYVEGHSIELIVQEGGNLGRQELPVSAF